MRAESQGICTTLSDANAHQIKGEGNTYEPYATIYPSGACRQRDQLSFLARLSSAHHIGRGGRVNQARFRGGCYFVPAIARLC